MSYFRLEITVHNTMMAHECERLQHLTCEAANEASREPMEVVRLDELIEVDAQ